eukprot:gene15675-biopygen17198
MEVRSESELIFPKTTLLGRHKAWWGLKAE